MTITDLAPQRLSDGTIVETEEDNELLGYDNLRPEDFVMPRIAITQAAARRKGASKHFGEFFRNLDQSYHPNLEVVFLDSEPNNTLWAEGESGYPECTARDGVHGSKYGDCRTCQFNRFANPEIAAKKKVGEKVKECHTGAIQYIMATTVDDALAVVTFHGKNATPAKSFASALRLQHLSLCDVKVVLTTHEDTNDSGRWAVTDFTITDRLRGEERAKYRAMARAAHGMQFKEQEPDVPEAASDEPLPDEPGDDNRF